MVNIPGRSPDTTAKHMLTQTPSDTSQNYAKWYMQRLTSTSDVLIINVLFADGIENAQVISLDHSNENDRHEGNLGEEHFDNLELIESPLLDFIA